MLVGLYEVFTFEGSNMGDGDQVHWVRVNSRVPDQYLEVDCNSADRTNTRQVLSSQATFTFERLGKYVLCYNWRYNDKESFLPFKHIKVAALQFSGIATGGEDGNILQLGGVSPLYSPYARKVQYIPTSLGCVANAYISGQGFELLGSDTPIMCNYDSRSSDPANSVPSSLATFTDEHLICAIPELPLLGDFGFHVSLGLAGSPRNITFNDIHVYDARTIRITSTSQAGSSYNLPVRVELRGTGLVALDDEKCVLGPSVSPPWTTKKYDSVSAKVYNSTYAVCDFDPIPDGDRDQVNE